MSDMNSLLEVLQGKIQAAADGASAEELAYLGTAVDRIGGRATVHEVMQIGNAKKAELAQIAQDLVDSMEAYTDEEQAALTVVLNGMIASYQESAEAILAGAEEELQNKRNQYDAKLTQIQDGFNQLTDDTAQALASSKADADATIDTLGALASEAASNAQASFAFKSFFYANLK